MVKKEIILVLVSVFIILSITAFASAGLSEWFGKITGRVTQNPVNLTITVLDTTAPTISKVYNNTVTLNEGPNSTLVQINFSASDPSGYLTINTTSAVVNLTRGGEATRMNATCILIVGAGNNANYSCNIYMVWFDGAGTWNITALIADFNNNVGQNTTNTFTVNALTGFMQAPSPLTWPVLLPNAYNQTSSNDPLTLNNTGNQDITSGNIQINATHLKGETDANRIIYSTNFSVFYATGGSPPVECDVTTMGNSVYTGLAVSNLTHGNFTINDGTIGQERLYFCLKYAGAELTSQTYSTASMGAWTVKIA